MKKSPPAAALAVSLALLASPVAAGPPAHEPDKVESSVQAVVAAVPDLTRMTATARQEQVSLQPDGVSHADAPSRLMDDEVALGAGEDSLRVGLPFADSASSPHRHQTGLAVTENHNGTSSVVATRNDGSAQLAVVIEHPNAPQRIPYQMDLPPDTQIRRAGDSIFFMSSGQMIGAMAPAWAVDASGRSVPTRYELNGNGAIVQVVDHDSSYDYPIVADPWVGKWLFEGFTTKRKTYKNKKVYSARLTPWGWAVYTGVAGGGGPIATAAGYKIIREAGWAEWKKKLVGNRPAISLEQQFVCHARFGYIFWKAGIHWDLEAARPSKPDWTKNPYSHKCNWS